MLPILIMAATFGTAPTEAEGWPTTQWSIKSDEIFECGQFAGWQSDPWLGERVLYLKAFTNLISHGRAQFDLGGTLEIIDFVPRPEWVNHGTATSLLLERAPCGPVVGCETVGELIVRDIKGAGGTLCFENSSQTGLLCAQDCTFQDVWFSISYLGFSSNGSLPCSGYGNEFCKTLANEPISWGSVKALYR